MNIAVFASGGGSNFQALIDKAKEGLLKCKIALLISNNSNAYAIERAKKHNIPYCHIAPSHFSSEEQYCNFLISKLNEYKIDLIVLAGYMKKIPAQVIRLFQNKIVNIHPALLPAFGGKGLYGEKVHQAVIDYGVKITGITIHFIDEEYDRGPIIFQESVKVLDTDDAHTLAERVLKVEHANYWRVIEAIAEGRIEVKGRRVYGTI
jgi:phosphoribosylglycinamide formyltransferase-1